jgi:hypothetical protein
MTLLQLPAITGLGAGAGCAAALVTATPRSDAETKHHARVACRQEAATMVPVLRTDQDEMNRLLSYSTCVEKRGYPMANRHYHG